MIKELKYILVILFCSLSTTILSAQTTECDCAANFGGTKTGDNYLEINFSNVSIGTEGSDKYLYFTIKLKRPGDWYDIENKSTLGDRARFIYSTNWYFDYNIDAFGVEGDGNAIEGVSYGLIEDEDSYWGPEPGADTDIYEIGYDVVLKLHNLGQYKIASINATYQGSSNKVYKIDNDYILFGSFKWKLKEGATGKTGVQLRWSPNAYKNEYKADRYSLAYSSNDMIPLGICVTGESLDIPIGEEEEQPAPEITKIEGSASYCEGATATFTPTVDDETATIKWVVKAQDGADVTDAVVKGGAIDETTGNTPVTIVWQDNATGTYSVCATPSNKAGDGEEFCVDVTVHETPKLELTASENTCAGETLTLTATSGLNNYAWFVNGSPVSGQTTNTYKPTLPTTGTAVTYRVTAESTAGCQAEATATVAINALPTADIVTAIAGQTSTATTYKVGDNLLFTAKNPDANKYDYAWTDDAGAPLATGTGYQVLGATETSYTVKLTVTDKITGCSATDQVELTKDASCNQSVALAGTANNTICTGGLAHITATMQNVCNGVTVTDYVWFKDGVKLDSISTTSNAQTNTYIAKEAGEYTVKVYTGRGHLTGKVTITNSGKTAYAITMPDQYDVQSGKSTWLTPECAHARSWNWEPYNYIAEGSAQQYAKTKGLTADQMFYVYVEDDLECYSMDSTKVVISADALFVEIVPENPTVCAGGRTTLHAQVTGGSAPYKYAWTKDEYSSGSTEEASTVISDPHGTGGLQKTRMVTVTDKNGKTGVASVQVTFVKTPNPELTIVGNKELCEGETLTVNRTDGVSTYTWTILDQATNTYSTQTGETLTLNKRGDYAVWVAGKTTDGTCTSDTTGVRKDVTVNGLDFAWVTEPADYQLGATISASVKAENGKEPYTYTWSTPAGGTAVTANTVTPNEYRLEGAASTSYPFAVTVKDQNGCTQTLEKTVLNTISGGLNLLADETVNWCTGGSAALKASASGGQAGYTFTWYLPGQESSPLRTVTLADGVTSDTYVSTTDYAADQQVVVKVTDASTPQLMRRDTITIKKRTDLTAPVIDAGADMKIAKNSATYLFATATSGAPTAWYWSDAAKLVNDATRNTAHPKTVALTANTTYTVYATDANGCFSATDEVTVSVFNDPLYQLAVALDPVSILCNGSQVTLQATVTPTDRKITSWNWLTTAADATFTGDNTATPTYQVEVSADGTADIFVQVTDNAGVSASNKITVNLRKMAAPALQLTGYTDEKEICSLEELTVSSTNGVMLGSAVWYVNNVEVQNGTKMTYQPSAESQALQDIRVEVVSAEGCPAANAIEEQIVVNPIPVLAWKETAASLLKPGDEVYAEAEVVTQTKENYTFHWSHTGSGADTYSDASGGTAALTARSEFTGTAAETTQPYCFQVYVEDGRGCRSATIDTTLLIDGDILLVSLTSKYGDYCEGGAAVLKASAIGIDMSGATIEWYKNNVKIDGESGQELMVETPNESDTYKVTVTSGKKSGEATLTLKPRTAKAPTLNATDLKIPSGTRTALWVTTEADIQSWQWLPEEKLAAGESKLRAPYTQILYAKADYRVYAVDNNNCVGMADVKVETMTVTKPTGSENTELMVQVIPESETVCRGNELGLNTAVWSTVSGTATYEWSPNDGHLSALDQAGTVFNPNNTMLPAGTYSYTVKVTKGTMTAVGRVDIEVVPGVLPGTPTVANSEETCAGGTLKVSAMPAADSYIWIVNGQVDATTGDTYTWPDVLVATNYDVQVVAKSGACRSNDTLKLNPTVQPAVKLDGKVHVLDTCGQVVVALDVQQADILWNVKAGDVTLVPNATGDTVTLNKKALWSAASEAYFLEVEVSPKGGGCKAKDQVQGKLFFQPQAEFDVWTPEGETVGLPYTMVEQGKDATVKVNTLTWNMAATTSAVNMNWSALHTDANTTLNVAGDALSATYRNALRDDSVVIRISNKEAEKCMIQDTMPIYLYPEAPTVKIDTVDGSFVKAALYMEGADNYTIWSRKWDPYCMTDAFTGDQVYVEEATGKNITSNIWKEINMDTLEFYYVTSGREIQGRTWNSKTTSDTVGYYRQDIKMAYNDQGVAIGGLNYIPYLFDMSAVMGGNRTSNFIEKIVRNVRGTQLSYFVHDEQRWGTCYYQAEIEFGGVVISPAEWKFDTTMHVGLAYLIQIEPDQTIMLYGKLSPRISYTLKNYPAGALNPGYLPAHHADMLETGDVVTEIRTDNNGLQVGVWMLDEQNFKMTYYQSAIEFGGVVISPATMKESKKIKPYTPLLYSVDKDDVFK